MTAHAQRKRRRRIMRALKINELSAVDFPAQQHALAVLMKRADPEEADMRIEKIGDDEIASFDNLDDAIDHLMDLHKCSRLEAMEKIGDPDLIADYNAQGELVGKSIAEARKPRAVSKAVETFAKRIDEIMARDHVSKLIAMEKAEHEFPDEFTKYQQS